MVLICKILLFSKATSCIVMILYSTAPRGIFHLQHQHFLSFKLLHSAHEEGRLSKASQSPIRAVVSLRMPTVVHIFHFLLHLSINSCRPQTSSSFLVSFHLLILCSFVWNVIGILSCQISHFSSAEKTARKLNWFRLQRACDRRTNSHLSFHPKG